jgi:hypothetical protein
MKDFEKWVNEKHPEYNEPEGDAEGEQQEQETEAVQLLGRSNYHQLSKIKDIDGLPVEYIDSGFYRISSDTARKLAGVLPKYGYEKLVIHADKKYWLARTPVGGKQVWSIREADPWRGR